MKELAKDLGLAGESLFIGRCADVPALLAVSDICVLSSRTEGFSNSILEYMAAGKPVVATNVGGAAEAVRAGENGFLVESDDDAALANRLLELLQDADKAQAMGKRGREIAENEFSTAAQLQKTLKLYDNLLQSV
jgi:glycosyltransferase involved in cell wall biosynthesis